MSDKNKVRCIFQIYESQYIDKPSLESYVNVDIESKEQSKFENEEKRDLIHRKSLFTSEKKTSCTINLNFELINKSNQDPIPITSDDIVNAHLIGNISSDDCKLEFKIDGFMSNPELLKAFIFTAIQVFMAIIGISPLYKMLKRNNMNQILILSEWGFMLNIMLDLILVVINLTFSMMILVEYFEFLTVVTMFLMFSILFKIRFYLFANEIRQSNVHLNPQQHSRKKFLFMLRFVALCIIAVACGNFLIEYSFIFYIFFSYPLFQIVYNFYGVTRKNCFLWELHLPFVISQIFYPIFMKGFSFSFFKLTPDRYFPFILICEVLFCLIILFLQKIFGACFFLPKCMIPNYFNYFRKFSSYPVKEDETCPICFSGLMENPEDTPEDEITDPKKVPLLPSKYMQTPCKHKFHENCLKIWMDQKLVCPCCRTNIPPII